jgi:hypothetical protein
MAFATPTAIKVASLVAGTTQVVGVMCADGHSYVYPTPTTGGAQYPIVRKLIPADVPPGTDSGGNPVTNTSVLWTVQMNGSTFSLPIDFTINDTTDWVIITTGTA